MSMSMCMSCSSSSSIRIFHNNNNFNPPSLRRCNSSASFSLNLAPNKCFRLPRPKNPFQIELGAKPKSLAEFRASYDPIPQTPSLKSRLRNGAGGGGGGNSPPLYGMFLCSFCPTLAEIAGHAGYDFVVVDMEHGFGDLSDALPCLRALSATHTPAILRLPESTPAWAKKALDLGPQGIMFPMIHSPLDARNAVSFCRYPPRGVRGAAHPIVRASAYGIDLGYLSNCEDDLLIMCQVESHEAVQVVHEIAAVDGVDCIQMGPTDLSASMDHLWDPANKKVMATLNKIEQAVLSSQKGEGQGEGAYLAGFAMPHDSPDKLKSRGYHMISGAVDLGLFRTAAVDDVKKFKDSFKDDDDQYDLKDEHYLSE